MFSNSLSLHFKWVKMKILFKNLAIVWRSTSGLHMSTPISFASIPNSNLGHCSIERAHSDQNVKIRNFICVHSGSVFSHRNSNHFSSIPHCYLIACNSTLHTPSVYELNMNVYNHPLMISWHYLSLTSSTGKNNLDKSLYPELLESDLEEKAIKGWGPGGQSVNKTCSACFLRHKPTGMSVKVHDSRSLEQNRRTARILLREKLDQHLNGALSLAAQMLQVNQEKLRKKQAKANKRLLMKQQWQQLLDNSTSRITDTQTSHDEEQSYEHTQSDNP